jgi:hypothetical protein
MATAISRLWQGRPGPGVVQPPPLLILEGSNYPLRLPSSVFSQTPSFSPCCLLMPDGYQLTGTFSYPLR